MYKLIVVGGPSRGSSYPVSSGTVSIGRVAGNDIVLSSSGVSKRHCVLIVDNTGVMVKDAGSSNGTFVNGMLAKSKPLSLGDRLTVGEYIFELGRTEPSPLQTSNPNFPNSTTSSSNILLFPQANAPESASNITNTVDSTSQSSEEQKRSLVEKLKEGFEKNVVNFLYNLNERVEWKNIFSGLFSAAIIFSIGVTAAITFSHTNEKLVFEARGRAALLARHIIAQNTEFVVQQTETKTDVSFAEKEQGVLSVYLVDMEGRILAPARKLNQYITDDRTSAAFVAAARKFFSNPEQSKTYTETFGNSIAVAEPMRVLNPNLGKNVSVALAVVFFDQRAIVLDSGTQWMLFLNAGILAAIFAVAAFTAMYRITLRPLNHLSDEIDQVLKGRSSFVSKKFKILEMEPLVDMINIVLQRLGGGSEKKETTSHSVSFDSLSQVLGLLANKLSEVGVLVLSPQKQILVLNSHMEEITGIRASSSVGGDFSAATRDEAFSSLIQDLLSRAAPGAMGVIQETIDFSGTNYRIECLALGSESGLDTHPVGFVILAERDAA